MKKFFLLSVLCSLALFAEEQTAPTAQTPSYSPKNYTHLIGMPGFSDKALNTHFKLYQGYVKNANTLLRLQKELENAGKRNSPEWSELRRRFGWEFDGMRLHELYFENLGGNGTIDPESPLYNQIVRNFGSYEAWKDDFVQTGAMRGIGWAILYQDPENGSLINVWINEHDLGHLAGGTPILIMDVFEHAFIIDYGLDKKGYIDAFFKNINWFNVNKRYTQKS